jgi:hypothetical protein
MNVPGLDGTIPVDGVMRPGWLFQDKVAAIDPNQGTSSNLRHWPRWNNGKQLLNFGVTENTILEDAFREQSGDFITKDAGVLHL